MAEGVSAPETRIREWSPPCRYCIERRPSEWNRVNEVWACWTCIEDLFERERALYSNPALADILPELPIAAPPPFSSIFLKPLTYESPELDARRAEWRAYREANGL